MLAGDDRLGSVIRSPAAASFGTAQAPGAAPLGGLVPDGDAYIGTTALGGGAAGQGDFYRFTP